MVFGKVMAGVAAASLAIAPAAASANTRADAAMPAVQASTIGMGDRVSASVSAEERLEGQGLILAALALAAIIAGIIIAVDGDDEDDDVDVSPGT